jgi:hypothetical protein
VARLAFMSILVTISSISPVVLRRSMDCSAN